MKTQLFIVACILAASIANGQDETFISPKNPGEITVTPPSFTMAKYIQKVDNTAMLNEYLLNKVDYPSKAKKSGYQGTEVILFTVTADGNVTDFKVINSVCHEIDEETIDAIKSTNGMWNPGKNNDVPVSMRKEVSLVFYIDDLSSKTQSKVFNEKAKEAFTKGTFEMYENRNAKKALKLYDQGVTYLPYDKGLLLMRGICKYELGDQKGAVEDWNRITSLGGINMDEYTSLIEKTKGYSEVMAILNK